MLSLLFTLALNLHAAEDCQPSLSLLQALVKYAPDRAEYQHAQDEALEAFGELTLWDGRDWLDALGTHVGDVTLAFTTLLSARARAYDALAETTHAQLAAALSVALGEPVDAAALRREVDAIAARPSVDRAFGYVTPLVRNPSPERIMAHHLHNFTNTNRQNVLGPHQAEIVRLIHQFGHYEAGERLVYLGVGAPAVLTGVAHNAGAMSYYALDEQVPTPATNAFLNAFDARVVPAYFDQHLLTTVAQGGPHRVMAAVDVLTTVAGAPRLGLAGIYLARALRELLTPGGTLIVLNDYAGPPPFTREQATAAGFEIVRWNADRRVRAELIPYVYPPDHPEGGQLRAFVLRAGGERVPSTLRVKELKGTT